MRVTILLAIVAIIAALGAVTSSIPIHQVSAQVGGPPASFPGSIPSGGHAKSPCRGGFGGGNHENVVSPPFCQ